MKPFRILPLVIVMSLLAVSCSLFSTDANPGSSDYLAQADVCDPKVAAALEEWADQGFAGSITVLGGDRPCNIGLGVADRDTGRNVTSDSAFSIGSITKTLVAAAIFDLADQGAISIDDTVGTYVEGLSGDVNDLQIRTLLLHTSGLTGYHGEDHVETSKSEALQSLSNLPIVSEQGTTYAYTNSGYTLLALVVDEVTEQGFRQFMVDEILRDGANNPIGGFWDGTPAVDGPRAFGYLNYDELGEVGEFNGPHWSMDGNGGIAMTTLEMAEWTRAFFAGEIISDDALEALLSTNRNLGGGDVELPGWGQVPSNIFGERAFMTSGGGGGIGHLMDVGWLPDTNRVVVIAKSAQTYTTQNLGSDITFPLVAGTGIPSPPVVPEADEETLASMVGTFTVDGTDNEVLVISRDDQGVLVAPYGSAAVPALFPPLPGSEAEQERLETSAEAFIGLINSGGDGPAESVAAIENYKAQNGEILNASLSGFVGVEFAVIELETADSVEVGAVWFNTAGGVEDSRFRPVDEQLSTDNAATKRSLNVWFVPQEDGGFAPFRPLPGTTPVRITPTSDGVEVQTGDDTITASRVE